MLNGNLCEALSEAVEDAGAEGIVLPVMTEVEGYAVDHDELHFRMLTQKFG